MPLISVEKPNTKISLNGYDVITFDKGEHDVSDQCAEVAKDMPGVKILKKSKTEKINKEK